MTSNPRPTGEHPTVPRDPHAPRRPGMSRRPWWEFVVPVMAVAMGAGFTLAAEHLWRGDVTGFVAGVIVLAYVVVTGALGYSLGRRDPSDRFSRDLYRGALVAELMTLGLAVQFLVWTGIGSNLSLVVAPWAIVFAHLFGLPVLAAAAGFGVSLGSSAAIRQS